MDWLGRPNERLGALFLSWGAGRAGVRNSNGKWREALRVEKLVQRGYGFAQHLVQLGAFVREAFARRQRGSMRGIRGPHVAALHHDKVSAQVAIQRPKTWSFSSAIGEELELFLKVGHRVR